METDPEMGVKRTEVGCGHATGERDIAEVGVEVPYSSAARMVAVLAV